MPSFNSHAVVTWNTQIDMVYELFCSTAYERVPRKQVTSLGELLTKTRRVDGASSTTESITLHDSKSKGRSQC